MNGCHCSLCIRTREFREALEKLPASDRMFWTDIYSHLFHAEADRDYYKAIVEGSWPNADEIISKHRTK
jgi:hypothetical protein